MRPVSSARGGALRGGVTCAAPRAAARSIIMRASLRSKGQSVRCASRAGHQSQALRTRRRSVRKLPARSQTARPSHARLGWRLGVNLSNCSATVSTPSLPSTPAGSEDSVAWLPECKRVWGAAPPVLDTKRCTTLRSPPYYSRLTAEGWDATLEHPNPRRLVAPLREIGALLVFVGCSPPS